MPWSENAWVIFAIKLLTIKLNTIVVKLFNSISISEPTVTPSNVCGFRRRFLCFNIKSPVNDKSLFGFYLPTETDDVRGRSQIKHHLLIYSDSKG